MHLIRTLKKLTPDWAKMPYQFLKALSAAFWHGFPSKKMVVVGITGTKGKTSAGNYVWSVLQTAGINTGLISSAVFRYGKIEKPNAYHMTMPSPFIIQRELSVMYKKGIRHVVVEMTSEGMKQFRNFGIPADIAIFTNLTPEHLASHKGSFEIYKKAKTSIFKSVMHHAAKVIDGVRIPRVIIANTDSEHASFYLKYPAEKKITYGIHSGDIRATNLAKTEDGMSFDCDNTRFETTIPGEFNVYNALASIATGQILGIKNEVIAKGISSLTRIPGRMDELSLGQDFLVYVDYAHEPASLRALLTTAHTLVEESKKIILLTGGQGGGRDTRKRAPMAELAGTLADYVIVTNEDPYDDDPRKIIEELAQGVLSTNKKVLNENLFSIMDRREAIEKAFNLAQTGDIVLITGKGSEQTMITASGAIPWNEREIATEILRKHVSRGNM